LALDLGPLEQRWRFSRLVLGSRHAPRIRERLEFVRGFFPEIDSLVIGVGLAKKRGVLGWGSLDPDAPAVWVRPRLLDFFTIAHEFTHLLQARRLVPQGERACDLWALARSPLLVDRPPGYLSLPAGLGRLRRLDHRQGGLLHEIAIRALAARQRGERRYLRGFERDLALAWTRMAPDVPLRKPRAASGRGRRASLKPVFAGDMLGSASLPTEDEVEA
jgi:hypothetical protein